MYDPVSSAVCNIPHVIVVAPVAVSANVPVQASSAHVPVCILILALFTVVCHFPMFAKVSCM